MAVGNRQYVYTSIKLMKKYLYLINDFAHDLFTGLWICSLLTLYLIQSKAENYAMPGVSDFIGELLFVFFWLQTWSMALIIITGFGRYFHVKSMPTKDDQPIRKKLLIIKHIILGVLFVGGSVLGYMWKA